MRILFITTADLANCPYGDGSTRYRCFNIAEVAQGCGCSATVMQIDQVQIADLSHFDIISWLRPEENRKFVRLINRAKQLEIRCIVDVDDLIFDPHLAEASPAHINAQSTQSSIRRRFARHARALSYADAITVSTRELQEHVTRLFPTTPVYTLHNGISAFWMSWAEEYITTSSPSNTITYLPGTRSHDRDFRSICPALSQWMQNYKNAHLNVVGKLSIDTCTLPGERWSLQPWVDYFELPAMIANCSATLAPLEDTVFNRAKSHVKFIESAALGVPLIASPIPDLQQHRIKGLQLVETNEQWFHALLSVVEASLDIDERKALQVYVQSHCTAQVYSQPLLDAWKRGHVIPVSSPLDESMASAA